jgi:hypothetical protein
VNGPVGGVLALHESQVGFVNGRFARSQIDKDLALLNAQRVQDVSWHFFASYTTGKIGPSATVLQRLQDAGITVYIHLPT